MIKKIAFTLFVTIASVFAIVLCIRGVAANPTESTLNTATWRDSGPFELSPERGRFALTYSLVENNSMYYSTAIARFVVPDLGYKDGHYVSLFAPGVSYLVMPGYIIGKALGSSQVGTFAVISLFALINSALITSITKRLGVTAVAATLAGLIFLFATPAFTYSVDLYQHHVSTLLILLSIEVLLRWNNKWSLAITWFLCAASIPVDYPNLFLMLPIGLWATGRFFKIAQFTEKYRISISIPKVLTLVAVVPPLLFFMWFNKQSYNNPLQFSGTISSVRAIDEFGNPASPEVANLQDVEKYVNPDQQHKSAVNFFQTRALLNGFYIHLISPDRGTLFFAPVILFSIFGFFILKRTNQSVLIVLTSVFAMDLLLYSMWGDPWGGWAFGSRYLIPGYAVLAILVGVFLHNFSKYKLVLLLFWAVMTYSVAVNTLGALTTSTNPPQVEALSLEAVSGKVEHYSFDRNYEFLHNTGSKSLVFQTVAQKYVNAETYYYLITGFLMVFLTVLLIRLPFTKNKII